MKKYKGRDRVVFLDGYAAGWKEGLAVGWGRGAGLPPSLTIHKPALRYTDAEKVPYVPDAPRSLDKAREGGV